MTPLRNRRRIVDATNLDAVEFKTKQVCLLLRHLGDVNGRMVERLAEWVVVDLAVIDSSDVFLLCLLFVELSFIVCKRPYEYQESQKKLSDNINITKVEL